MFALGRILNPASYVSGGAGMAGTAGDVLTFLETIRRGVAPTLQEETVELMMSDQVGIQSQTRELGWGFGYGWAVLGDPSLAKSPQSQGSIQWGAAFGHNWFVDPSHELVVVCMTNTTFEGMGEPFTEKLRDMVYYDLAASLHQH
ncbi:serine hydrolase [Serratia nevei]|uniref:serine hydrolase n=1 Tax=Serratia nevei TaxID=2703794 RepID=UPI003FA6C787